ncbi:MAG: hypothetical protein J2P57_05520, partial [Acidimicrobiaceae bacterium]|nr:hypothetical protein [Acidimicrobiaceae bacterium]
DVGVLASGLFGTNDFTGRAEFAMRNVICRLASGACEGAAVRTCVLGASCNPDQPALSNPATTNAAPRPAHRSRNVVIVPPSLRGTQNDSEAG